MRLLRIKVLFILCVCSAGAYAQGIYPDDVGAALDDTVLQNYKTIHRQPELGKAEFKTAKLVRSELERMGYADFASVPALPTAVIAILDTGKPGPVTVLRSELDARPGDEKSDLPFKSQVPHVMHSCGHDAHTAMLLGAAEYLMRHRADLVGKVVFLFQPAEEVAGGADDIVKDGILTRLQATSVFAQHVAPGLPVGAVLVQPGVVMAGSTSFTVSLSGDGSHAAAPHDGSDIVRAAAELLVEFAQFPARHLNVVTQPTVVSVTHFVSGDHAALNVIPGKAVFEGTTRSFEDLRGGVRPGNLLDRLEKYLKAGAAARGLEAAVEWRVGAPVNVNSQKVFGWLAPALQKEWPGQLMFDGQRSMFSEDFAFYTAGTPSLFLNLGIAKDGLGENGVHTDGFNLHPDALKAGTRLLITIARAANGPGAR